MKPIMRGNSMDIFANEEIISNHGLYSATDIT
jgi:hypothetical protein